MSDAIGTTTTAAGGLAWNLQRVPRTLPDGSPHPARTSAIFVVHGIGEQAWTATAVQLRSGLEDALTAIETWQRDNPRPDAEDLPARLLPPPFIFEGYWANYDDIKVTFPEDWSRFNPREQRFFEGLWKTRVFSATRTLSWFLRQLVRLLSPRVFSEVGPLAWPVYLLFPFAAVVTLLAALLFRPKIITAVLGDVRLYLDPRGVVERAIVRRIDERVRDAFLTMIGLTAEFRLLAEDRQIDAAGEHFVFERVVWVAHSLGTVISYNVLSDLLRTAETLRTHGDDAQKAGVARFERALTRFVTMGSPLDKVAFLFGSTAIRPWPRATADAVRESPSGAKRTWDWWINFYHVLDPVSGALESPLLYGGRAPRNYHARSGIIPGLAHLAYWSDVTTLRYILGRTYGPRVLRDQKMPAWPPWVLSLLALIANLVWLFGLGGAVYGIYRWAPTIARTAGKGLLAWLTG